MKAPLPEARQQHLGQIACISKIFPWRAAAKAGSGWRSPLLPSVILNATICPLWLMGRWSLKPENQPMVLRPRLASPGKTQLG